MTERHRVVIQRTSNWIRIDWLEIVRYRDLLYLMVRRDFLSKYKQTVLGPAWFIVQPLITTLVFTVIFGKMTHISTDGLPPALFYMCGLLPWSYFAQCLNSISWALINNADIFSKVYFPRLIVPISIVISSLMTFVIQAGIFLLLYVYYKFFTVAGPSMHLSSSLLILPLLLLEASLLALGAGLAVASLTVRYRDIQHTMSFVIQLWMYATPIIYPMSVVPERWRPLVALNPMAGIVESFRYAFFQTGFVSNASLLASGGMTILFLLVGLVSFNVAEATMVDLI